MLRVLATDLKISLILRSVVLANCSAQLRKAR